MSVIPIRDSDKTGGKKRFSWQDCVCQTFISGGRVPTSGYQ